MMNLMSWPNRTTPRFSLLISFLVPAPTLRHSRSLSRKKTNPLKSDSRTRTHHRPENVPLTPKPFHLPVGARIHHTAKWLGCLIQQQTFNQAHLPPDPIGGLPGATYLYCSRSSLGAADSRSGGTRPGQAADYRRDL